MNILTWKLNSVEVSGWHKKKKTLQKIHVFKLNFQQLTLNKNVKAKY